jgi:TPR repeat protein
MRKGQGLPQDDREAAKWYKLAAAQGNASAQTKLGGMYASGTGVSRDLVRAHMWLSLAASGDAGDTAAKNRNSIASEMTAEQIAAATSMASRCRDSKLKKCD